MPQRPVESAGGGAPWCVLVRGKPGAGEQDAEMRIEGLSALWKGSVPRFARTAPHTVLTFVLFERARSIVLDLGSEAPEKR